MYLDQAGLKDKKKQKKKKKTNRTKKKTKTDKLVRLRRSCGIVVCSHGHVINGNNFKWKILLIILILFVIMNQIFNTCAITILFRGSPYLLVNNGKERELW